MKLRYYLRGIGIGIIIAAAICICASMRKGTMSDDEVRQKAKELGMTESGNVLSDMAAPVETQAETETAASDYVETVAEPVAESETEAIETPVEESTVIDVAEEQKEQEPSSEAEAAEPPSQEPSEEAKEEQKPVVTGDTVTIVIEKGNGSDTVARKLASAGLISDAAAYDKWLIQNGYDRVLAAGTHQIPKGASEEEIAKILSGRK